MNGYTVPAQKFAATYRIPLLEFNQMPYWDEFCDILHWDRQGAAWQLPESIFRLWLDKSTDELSRKKRSVALK